MKRIVPLVVAIVLLCSCASRKNAKDLVLVENHNTNYHIILSKHPTNNEIYAAKLLQEYLYKISGAKVPIVDECRKQHNEEIIIGKSSRHPLATDKSNTIAVKRNGTTLVFGCNDDKYTMYSVLDFIERELGVRCLAPDANVYPNDSNIILKNFSSYSETSPNVYREVHSSITRNDTNMQRWLKSDLQEERFAKGFFVHTSSKLLPPEEYFDSHPEYFSLVNGKHSRDQMCWSNDEVYNIVKNNLKANMIIQSDKKVWSVSQNDNDTYCHCDKCMQIINKYGSNAAPIILFVNRLAKDFPDKTISTLAYQFSRHAPRNLKLENNVEVMLCTIEADRNKTIEQQGNEKGSFADDLREWRRLNNNIFLWDYDVDFAYSIAPFPNIHVLQPNIQFFTRNGANMHFQQANGDIGHEFAALKTYLIAKLLWNPDLDVEKTIKEFVYGYYGKNAGKFVYRYIRDIEATAINTDVVLDIYGSPVRYKDNILSESNIKRFDNYFDSAENAASNDSTYLLRVMTERLSLDYAIMEIAKTDMFGQRGWFSKENGKYSLKQDMVDRLERFHYITTKIGALTMNESNFSPEDYYTSTKRFLDVDISNDMAFHKKVTADTLPDLAYGSGDLATLTDGVKGADDYHSLWIGWWGKDFSLNIDLDTIVKNKSITISSLACNKSWILHPLSIECLVSKNGKKFVSIGTIDGDGFNRNNPIIKEYKFTYKKDFRYIKFNIRSTKTLPSWHVSYTKPSWTFLDEIIVK